MSIRKKAKIVFERAQTLCSDLNRSQKFFFFGALLGLIALLWWVTPFDKAFLSVAILSGLLLVSGVISDLLSIYARTFSTTLGKGVLLLLYALATTTAYALATQIVNQVIAFEASNLSNAVVFVAILLVPILILGFTYILFALIFILGQFYLVIAMFAESLKHDECFKDLIPKNFERYPGVTFCSRLIIYPATLGFIWGLGGNLLPKYEDFVDESASAFIYHLEAVKFSRCENVPTNAKVIHINDTEVVIATMADGEYTFEPAACVPRIVPNKSRKADA